MTKLIIIAVMTLTLLTLGHIGYDQLFNGGVDAAKAVERFASHLGAMVALTLVLGLLGYGAEGPYSGGGSGDSGL